MSSDEASVRSETNSKAAKRQLRNVEKSKKVKLKKSVDVKNITSKNAQLKKPGDVHNKSKKAKLKKSVDAENIKSKKAQLKKPGDVDNKSKKAKLKPPVDVENTIFVGNLPNTINPKDVKNIFINFGDIVSARLRCAIRKELKIPKKLAVIKKEFHEDSEHINAYVKFESSDSCKKALKMNGVLYQGRHLRVNFASEEGKSDPKRSIFLGNLPFKVQDDGLWEAFEDCGAIKSVRVIRDEKTGIGKGFGYVNFENPDSVELALQLNGVVKILDRTVRVSRVQTDGRKSVGKVKPKSLNDLKSGNKTKPGRKEKVTKPSSDKIKTKKEFQGQKTKRSIHKKIKKKKTFDKKKMVIKQIAEGMKKVR